MMRSTVIVLSACLLNCAFALPALSDNPIFKPKEIKFDGSADWSRIIGGSDASDGQFPYIASLRRSNSHFCGAVIISAVYLLSAAHCTDGLSPASVTAVVGTTTLNSGGTDYVLANILTHPEYDYDTIEHDISLLRTASSIVGSSVVASIPIGSTNIGAGFAVTLSGWGVTSSGWTPNNLQFIELSTIETEACAARFPYPVFETNLCTLTQAGEGACYGDSGGPLVASGVLVGLVSWGQPCAVGYPDVFTRVSSYVSWIQENAV